VKLLINRISGQRLLNSQRLDVSRHIHFVLVSCCFATITIPKSLISSEVDCSTFVFTTINFREFGTLFVAIHLYLCFFYSCTVQLLSRQQIIGTLKTVKKYYKQQYLLLYVTTKLSSNQHADCTRRNLKITLRNVYMATASVL
jgi:hypothetical protein